MTEIVRRDGIHWKAVRAPGDLLALATLSTAFWASPRAVRWACSITGAYLGILLVFDIDRMIFRFIMGSDPLLYDQVFMLRHLFVLIHDLWSLRTAAMVALALAALCGAGFAVVHLARVARRLFERRPGGHPERVMLVAWLVALLGTSTAALGLTRKPLVRWTAVELYDSVGESVATYRSIQRSLAHSPYASYDRYSLMHYPWCNGTNTEGDLVITERDAKGAGRVYPL